jgi:alcohol dehydrogenase
LNDPGSFATRQGHPNCCENLRVLGVHTDGGLRPRFVLPARKLHRSNGLSHDQAALVELLAVGNHAVRRGHCKSSEHVLVLGAGPLGLSAALGALRTGAQVMVMDPDPARLEFVRQRLGLSNVIQVLGDDSDLHRIEQCTGGHLAQCVIETTGSHRMISESVRFAAFAGRVVLAGLTGSELTFSHPFIHRRELTILASRNALPEDFKGVIEAMETGALEVRHWITHTASFQESIGEFGKWLNPTTGTIRAVVRVEA